MSTTQTAVDVSRLTPAERKALLAQLAGVEGVNVKITPKKADRISVIAYTNKKGASSVKGTVVIDGNDFNQLMVGEKHAAALLRMEQKQKGAVLSWLAAVAGQKLNEFQSRDV